MNEQVAAKLRRQIEDEGWEPGRRMPSVREVADRHGVSTVTARRSLQLLSDWGYVRPDSTRGYFVTSRAEVEEEQSPEYVAIMRELRAIRSDVQGLAERLRELEERVQHQ